VCFNWPGTPPASSASGTVGDEPERWALENAGFDEMFHPRLRRHRPNPTLAPAGDAPGKQILSDPAILHNGTFERKTKGYLHPDVFFLGSPRRWIDSVRGKGKPFLLHDHGPKRPACPRSDVRPPKTRPATRTKVKQANVAKVLRP